LKEINFFINIDKDTHKNQNIIISLKINTSPWYCWFKTVNL